MHLIRSVLLVILLALNGLSQESVLEKLREQQSKTGIVKGTVRHSDTKDPIPFANVMLLGTAMGSSTNTEGNFVIAKVPEGNYTLIVSLVGHKSSETQITVRGSDTVTVMVALINDHVQLNEILVYGASLRKERITEAPAAISVVEGKGLQRSSSAGQLPKLLEGQPGVDLVQSGLYDFNLNTRGFNSSLNRRVLILLDGRDLGTAFLSSTEWNGMSTPLEDLGRVEMVRGPGSALYGANAYNGVLNITSLPPRSVLGTKVIVGAGELQMYRGDIRHAGEIDHLSYKVNVGGMSGKTFSKSRIDKSLNQNVFEYDGFNGILNAEVEELNTNPVRQFYLSGRLDYAYEQGGISTAEAGITQVENEVIVTGIGRVQVQRARRPFARLNYNGHGINFNLWSQSRINMAPEKSISTGLSLIQNANISQGELQYSTQMFDDKIFLVGGSSLRVIDIDTEGTLMTEQRNDRSVGVFAQVEYKFSQALKFVFASRYDQSTLHENFLSPKAALVWAPFADHTFRATYNRAFQAPNYSELYLNVKHPFRGLVYYGNPDLKVEKVNGYDIGYNGIFGRSVFLSIDLFYNELSDFITDLGPGVNLAYPPSIYFAGDSIPGRPRGVERTVWSYGTAGEVNEYGYDVAINYYVTEELLVDANYSYFNFEVIKKHSNDVLVPNASKWKLNGGLTYENSHGFDISIKVKYVPTYFWAAGIYRGNILAYTLLNVAGNYQFDNNIAASFNISNLLNRQHYQIFGGSLIGRRSTISVSYMF